MLQIPPHSSFAWEKQFPELWHLLSWHFELNYTSDELSIEDYINNVTDDRYLNVIHQIKTILSSEPFLRVGTTPLIIT
jgi:hypothetical protein